MKSSWKKIGRSLYGLIACIFLFMWAAVASAINTGVLDTVVASTYLGGSQVDEIYSVSFDADGNVFVAGRTNSASDFASGCQNVNTTYKGTYEDAFVAKFDPSLQNLLAVAYLGGKGFDGAYSVKVDSLDNVFVAGYTTSTDFPVTPGAFDTTFGGVKDAFVASFSNDLSTLNGSTYLGGTGEDISYSFAFDSFFDIYVAGTTRSADLPATGTYSGGVDSFIGKLTNDLSSLTAAVYMGGASDDHARAVAFDGTNVFVAGYTRSNNFNPPLAGGNMGNDDIFVSKYDQGLAFVSGVLIGGSQSDLASAVALDGDGNVFVAGRTGSIDLPVPGGWSTSHGLGGYDAFALKLDNSLNLQAGTYLGGSGYDFASSVAVDQSGKVLVAGSTGSLNFPPAISHSGGGYDAFAVMLDNSLANFESSSVLGGSGQDDEYALGLNPAGEIYVAGRSGSPDFPVINGWDLDYNGGSYDGFVAKYGINRVYIPDMTGAYTVEIPVNVFVSTGIAGFNFKITYDKDVITAIGVVKGDLLDDTWEILGNTTVPGVVNVGGYSINGAGLGVGTGSLVKIIFNVISANESSTLLSFDHGEILSENVTVLNAIYQNGSFTVESGTLELTTGPVEAINAGASFSIDGGTTWIPAPIFTSLSLSPGTYTIQYSDIGGWTTPGDQQVEVTLGATTTATGTYTRVEGYLNVAIEPQEAVNAGARWSIDGGTTWYESGQEQVGTGTYTVLFNGLTGFDKPADIPGVVVTEGQVTGPLTGTYVQHMGSLTVTINPQGAIDAGAQWSVDGGATWNDSGATIPLPVGTNTVSYKQVANWNEPANEDVVVVKDQLTTEEGTYARQMGDLTVNITPQGAADAGAQWSIDGGTTWRNSGTTIQALLTGPFTITFSPIQGGYGTPADMNITLAQGANTFEGRYTWTWNVNPDGSADFTTIQAAIDGSAPGDTILVAPGTYNEFLNINKDDLIIRSTGGASVTTVNIQVRTSGQGGVVGGVVFYNSGITLDGFTIQDSTVQSGEIKIIRIGNAPADSNNNTLTNCVIKGNIDTPTNKTDYGILVYGSDNTISGNEICNVGYTGINVVGGPWSDDQGNTISNNSFHDIGIAGSLSYGITIDRSGNNKLNIEGNTFSNFLGGDKSWAMVVWGQMAEGTHISGHNISGIYNGISLASARGVYVTGNNISVPGTAIRLFYSSWAGPVVDDNVIINNTITGSATGFLINPGTGGAGVIGANNVLAFNNIYGNTMGAENLNTVEFDARNNWWGDVSGPLHPTTNPQGLGNQVSDLILFDPCLGAPVTGGGALDFDNPSYENGDAGLGVDVGFEGGEEGKVIVTVLGTNPTGVELFDGSFFDVFVSELGDISEIKVKLYYNEPSAKIAYWFNGTTWVECTSQQVVAGAVTVGGVNYDGYVEVTINDSTTPSLANLTGTFFALRGSELYKGRLTVTITPADAVTAGAQWSIDDGANWNNSGDYFNFLDAGTYTVTFRDGIAGYLPPADIQVDVVDGETDSVAGNYFSVLTVNPDGSADFTTIQAAINAANPGDTILVSPGTYNESITIYQRDGLTIQSTGGAAETIINSANNVITPWVVRISSDNVTFDGFTLRHYHDFNNEYMVVRIGYTDGIYMNADGNVVKNCIIQGNLNQPGVTNQNDFGICVFGENNQIIDNEVFDIGYVGINLTSSNNRGGNTVSGNNVHNIGVYGITVDKSPNNDVAMNEISNLVGGTLWGEEYLPLESCHAIVVWGAASEGSVIRENQLTDVPYGITLSGAMGVYVQENSMTVDVAGVRIGTGWAGPLSDNNVIVNNNITGDGTGLLVNPGSGTIGTNNVFAFNNIYGNVMGAENLGTDPFDARNNWWGDVSGPYHPVTNTDGQGNAVSDNILFDPWLGIPTAGGEALDYGNPSYENGGAGLGVDVGFEGGEEGLVIVTVLGSNPTGLDMFDGSFFDVFVSELGDISEIKIKLYYNEPSAKVAYWFNGTTWVECSNQQVVAGPFNIDGTDYAGYVEVTINGTTIPSLTDLTGTFFALRNSELNKGSLTVNIEPQAAINAGAKWSVDGGATWYSGGDTVELVVGSYTVTYKQVGDDWSIPADAPVDITKDGQVSLTGTYVLLGDINGDGSVDILDVMLALRMTVELPVEIDGQTWEVAYPEWLILRADYDESGDVNISDVMLILRRSIGID